MSAREPLIALAGNPNTGKTTLFNALTGSRARVGNYPGITVEKRSALMNLEGRAATLLDIPGCYSLVARSPEEQIALEAMLGVRGAERPDTIVFCVSATQLVRNLYLVVQAQELGVRAVVALTMTDEAREAAPPIDELAAALGCPVVPVVAHAGTGLDDLRRAVAGALDAPVPKPGLRWKPSPSLRAALDEVRAALPPSWPRSDGMAVWALMSVTGDDELAAVPDELRRAVEGVALDGETIDDEVIEGRYRWLDRNVAKLVAHKPDRSRTERVDRILLNRFAGFAVFLGLMFVVFQALFAWSDPAITLIEETFAWLGGESAALLGEGIFTEFVVDGLIGGVGSVIVFLPQILLLFFFIGLMEDSGYMARVAYLMDRIMRSMNLNGRAFVPMLSGFACAVPAILATRTMERRRDRLLTMMVVPLMTCSARLPVYTLIIAALFPASQVLGIFPVQGLLMICMYVFSTLTALVAAWVLSRTVRSLKADRLPLVVELPPYRLPRTLDVARMMWERTMVFVKEAGTVILVCTIVLWALLAFPREAPSPSKDWDVLIAEAHSPERVDTLEKERAAEQRQQSYGGRLGHAIEPAIAPLGFDWKIGVGIIGAFAAREVFISTMGVVYGVGDDVDEESVALRDKMRDEMRADGRPVYSPLVGLSLMVFFALACQCMSTLAAVKRETMSYRWPAFLFVYMTSLAWVASLLVYQGGRLLGFA